MKKVIIFSAPPRCGKDMASTLAIGTLQTYGIPAAHKSFKTPLIELTAIFLGLSVEEFLKDYDANTGDVLYKKDSTWILTHPWWKDVPIYAVDNKRYSKRTALQHVSENVIKPVFGDEVFGQISADNLVDGYNVFSDGGFKSELSPIIDKVGVDNVLVIRIHMDGVGFEGDTRGYIQDDWFDGLRIIDIDNVWGEQDDFLHRVRDIIVGEVNNA